VYVVPVDESVVPLYERPAPMRRVETAPVPFPFKIPVRVVEPVPPRATVRVPVVSAKLIPRDEVAKAVMFPVAPVKFPRIVFAAI
jgi:hypothetical protein